MGDVHENSDPLMPPPTPKVPVPTTPLDLVEIFSYLLISKRELQKFTTLNVDQKGIDFISILLYNFTR